MNFSTLEKKYKGKKINEIEKEIIAKNQLSLEARKSAIFALRYLETTGRYKENPTYKKSSFTDYLMGYFAIRETTYRDAFRAFDKFEDETVKYGVGLISKVLRTCGAKKEKRVIEEIKKADKALKNPIQRDKIKTIINKYAKPTPPTKPGYKALYVAERRLTERLTAQLKDALAVNARLVARVEKLKATVLKLKSPPATHKATDKTVEMRAN